MDLNNLETLKTRNDLMTLKLRKAFKSATLVKTKKYYYQTVINY
jgi:hypothetical protein